MTIDAGATIEPPQPVLGLQPHARVERESNASLVVRHPTGTLRLGVGMPRLEQSLSALHAGASLEELERQILESDAPEQVAHLYYLLFQLQRLGLLQHQMVVDGVTWLQLLAAPPGAMLRTMPLLPEKWLRLSRFATLRGEEDVLLIECSRARSRVLVAGPAVGQLALELVRPRRLGDLSSSVDLSARVIVGAVAYLLAAGAFECCDAAGRSEAEDDVAAVWEAHDLAFHRRSRRGSHPDPIGGTYRLAAAQEPEPAVPSPRAGERIPLATPSARALAKRDPSLFSVMESRRSLRRYGASPITLDQLGELLYRVARIRAQVDPDPDAGRLYGVTNRPYPNGGGAYELELYLTVARCVGLSMGCYYYDALDHRLVRLSTSQDLARALLDDAAFATGREAQPHVLLTVTSRFKRLAWKYSGMAYATTLKNVGVLFQSMYLSATAMGLSPCALGSGDSELAVAALGLDELRECPVGEFILGPGPDRPAR